MEEIKENEIQSDTKTENNSTEKKKVDKADLYNSVMEVLKSCYDPEIPVNIYELGLIYEINIDEEGKVDIKMTLTSPACPVAGSLPPEVESKIKAIPGVKDCKIEVVWAPTWGMHMMSEAARLQLNLM